MKKIVLITLCVLLPSIIFGDNFEGWARFFKDLSSFQLKEDLKNDQNLYDIMHGLGQNSPNKRQLQGPFAFNSAKGRQVEGSLTYLGYKQCETLLASVSSEAWTTKELSTLLESCSNFYKNLLQAVEEEIGGVQEKEYLKRVLKRKLNQSSDIKKMSNFR